MGRSNASYIEAVRLLAGNGPRAGRGILSRAVPSRASTPADIEALRFWSQSEFVGQQDGKTINAALREGSRLPEELAILTDACRIWTLPFDAILWRGSGVLPPLGRPSQTYISFSAVERVARRIRRGGGAGLTALVLRAGTPFGIPARAWSEGDDERTLRVVRGEAEIVLPIGSVLDKIATVDGLPGSPRGNRRVLVVSSRADPSPGRD